MLPEALQPAVRMPFQPLRPDCLTFNPPTLAAGPSGFLLGLTVLAVTGLVCITVDRLLGGTGIAGAAASSTAGNSAAVPQAVALADPSYALIAPAATIQVAASVIVTAIGTPLITSWWYRRVQKQRGAVAPAVVVIETATVTREVVEL